MQMFQITLNFLNEGPSDGKSVEVQVMSWRRVGDKP